MVTSQGRSTGGLRALVPLFCMVVPFSSDGFGESWLVGAGGIGTSVGLTC